MSLKIIELNDSGIKVGDHRGIAVASPGFALVVDNDLVLGDQAEEQARLQPTKSYNKYWHELSMEPLNHGNHLRHTADIAYAHLLHLAEVAEIDSDVVFAVPGSFSNQQLAILLGLAKQSPIKPVGVVDSAVAAAVAAEVSHPSLYLDFQLHQVVVTKLNYQNGNMVADSVVHIPGVGIQNFINLMMQQATDLFIEQCRFNPQHNAEYEQLLYNQLPTWLDQYEESQTNLVLELKTSDALHVAKMPKEGFIASLQGHYKKINQELEPLLGDQYSNIILSQNLASLPGYKASMPSAGNVHVLQENALISACLENVETLVKDGSDIHWVRSLPVKNTKADVSGVNKQVAEAMPPTHLVSNHQAVAINGIQICNAKSVNGNTNLDSNVITVEAGELPHVLAQVSTTSAGVYLESGELEFYLNSKLVKGSQKIGLGDQIRFGQHGAILTAIQVRNG